MACSSGCGSSLRWSTSDRGSSESIPSGCCPHPRRGTGHPEPVVLNIAHPAAWDYVFGRIDELVGEYAIDYIKWDHNRELHEAARRDANDRPGVNAQTRALYRMLDALKARHPSLEIESCASGGGRIDLGIPCPHRPGVGLGLQRSRRAAETQRWTAQLIPPELMGAHVASARSHTTNRTTSLSFRLITSLFAHAGIEEGLTRASAAELEVYTAWAALYKRVRGLIHWPAGSRRPVRRHVPVSRRRRARPLASAVRLGLPGDLRLDPDRAGTLSRPAPRPALPGHRARRSGSSEAARASPRMAGRRSRRVPHRVRSPADRGRPPCRPWTRNRPCCSNCTPKPTPPKPTPPKPTPPKPTPPTLARRRRPRPTSGRSGRALSTAPSRPPRLRSPALVHQPRGTLVRGAADRERPLRRHGLIRPSRRASPAGRNDRVVRGPVDGRREPVRPGRDPANQGSFLFAGRDVRGAEARQRASPRPADVVWHQPSAAGTHHPLSPRRAGRRFPKEPGPARRDRQDQLRDRQVAVVPRGIRLPPGPGARRPDSGRGDGRGAVRLDGAVRRLRVSRPGIRVGPGSRAGRPGNGEPAQ